MSCILSGLVTAPRLGYGEAFCYVKLDGRNGFDEDRFADQREMEDALDAA